MGTKSKAYAEFFAKTALWLIITAIAMAATIYGAFVFGQIWDWFIVPAGFETLGLKFRVGIFLLVSLIFMGLRAAIADGNDDNTGIPGAVARVLGILVAYTVAWGFAAIWNWLL